jgi:5-formyltetrahydrofolate cyclo-ligase
VKKLLRKQAVEARDSLSQEERQTKSREIGTRLFRLPEYHAASCILFFASFRSEVDTLPMIQQALAEGKRVILPKVKGKDLELFKIKDFEDDTVPGTWGISEPHKKNPVMLDAVDLIIVPGLAFDEQCNRLGYGAGFYDRLLANYTGAAIAIAFEKQIVLQVPVTAGDLPVSKIVTEKRIIERQAPITK